MCVEVIEKIGLILPTMMKLNVIPVIVHQETDKIAQKFFSNSKDQFVSDLLFAKTTKKIQNLLGLANASIGSHIKGMVKGNIVNVMLKKNRAFTLNKHIINPLVQFGLFLVDKFEIKKNYITSDFGKFFFFKFSQAKRINFGYFINDFFIKEIDTDFSYIEKMNKIYPNIKIEKSKISEDFNLKKVKVNDDEENPYTLKKCLENYKKRKFLKGFFLFFLILN
jgi:hypothetical protein